MRFYRTIIQRKAGFFVSSNVVNVLDFARTDKTLAKTILIVVAHWVNRVLLYHKITPFAQIAYR